MTEPQPPVPAPSPAPSESEQEGATPGDDARARISIDDFQKVRLLTAEVVEATLHPNADRLLILQLKVGERRKQIVSGIRPQYTPENIVGKTVVVVDNLKPAKLRGELSEGMLLAVSLPEGGYRILTTDSPAPSGLAVS